MIATVFSMVRRFYAAPPPAPPVPASQVAIALSAIPDAGAGIDVHRLRDLLPRAQQRFASSRWRCRERSHYTKEMIGDITAMTALAYGLSKFLMGSVSDKSNSRRFMSTGLMLTAICNFAFGASSNYWAHMVLWALNGFAQGMGWPPCGRVMGHWYSESERGLTFSIWNTSHNLGAGIIGVFVAWVVEHIRRLAIRVLRAGSNCGGRRRLFVSASARYAGIGRLAARRGVSQRLTRWPIEAVDLERELTFRELLVRKGAAQQIRVAARDCEFLRLHLPLQHDGLGSHLLARSERRQHQKRCVCGHGARV